VATGPPLEAVICACCPGEGAPYDLRALVHELVTGIHDAADGGTRITVFTDLEGATSELGYLGVGVYEMEQARAEHDVPAIQSPCLRLVAEAMGDTSVDVVHFICPGHLDASFGALLLDAPRTRDAGPPPVQAGEVCAFMTHIGAWAVAFTIPSVRAWPAGTRVLAHRVMKDVTGPVVVDAPHHREREPGIGEAYRLLFGSPPVEPPCSPGMSIYVHPQRVQTACETVERVQTAVAFESERISVARSLTLAGTSLEDSLTSTGQPPRRLAAKQRELEQWASQLLRPGGESPYAEAANQGLADALTFVKNLLAEESRPREDERR
jgi:hypothetical protein